MDICPQGANINIKVWDQNLQNRMAPYDLVDEFSYDLTDPQGSVPRIVSLNGIRSSKASR